MKSNWCTLYFVLLAGFGLGIKDAFGVKLERKQDLFDVEPYEANKRGGYGLSEIGKRGFSSSLGFDYASATGTDFDFTISGTRSGGSGEALSPARDLIPPAAPSTYSPTSRTDYSKYHARLSSSPSSTKFPAYTHRSVSRRSPHLPRLPSSSRHYFDDIPSSSTSASPASGGLGNRGRYNAGSSFGLVADTEGKLIGYRGSILPGFPESQSIHSSSSPDSTNFIGGYYSSPKYPHGHGLSTSASSSSSSGRYSNTPVYYPGKEEDHTYRMRDTTSQGYDDEDSPSSEDHDFPTSPYHSSPSPFSHSHPHPPPSYHYRDGSSDGLLGARPPPPSPSNILESSRFLPYSRSSGADITSGFSYGPIPKAHNRVVTYDYSTKRSHLGPPTASPPSTYDSVERTSSSPLFGFPPFPYNDFGNAPSI